MPLHIASVIFMMETADHWASEIVWCQGNCCNFMAQQFVRQLRRDIKTNLTGAAFGELKIPVGVSIRQHNNNGM
jgi:hypothetical protein